MGAPSVMPSPSARQPVMFIPHGAGPCFFMEWNPPGTWDGMANYLRSIAPSLPAPPRAILMVSAHWRTADFSVTAASNPALFYDYYGFPDSTYALTYPAPGSPALAERVTQLLDAAGLTSEQDTQRGFDHGMFIPLKVAVPDADIPVVQLSLRSDLNAAAHIEAGKALASLRDEGILIIGSGMSFHNMRGYGDARFTAPSEAFDAWLSAAIEADAEQRNAALSHWEQAPYAHHCHPAGQQEHLIPLMVVAGAAGEDIGRKVYSEQVLRTQLSAFQFG